MNKLCFRSITALISSVVLSGLYFILFSADVKYSWLKYSVLYLSIFFTVILTVFLAYRIYVHFRVRGLFLDFNKKITISILFLLIPPVLVVCLFVFKQSNDLFSNILSDYHRKVFRTTDEAAEKVFKVYVDEQRRLLIHAKEQLSARFGADSFLLNDLVDFVVGQELDFAQLLDKNGVEVFKNYEGSLYLNSGSFGESEKYSGIKGNEDSYETILNNKRYLVYRLRFSAEDTSKKSFVLSLGKYVGSNSYYGVSAEIRELVVNSRYELVMIFILITVNILMATVLLVYILSVLVGNKKLTVTNDAAERKNVNLEEISRSFNTMIEKMERSNSRLIEKESRLTWEIISAKLSHELKNPLTPIKLSAERILKRFGQDEFESVLRKSVKTILDQVDVLEEKIEEFNEFVKVPALMMSNGTLIESIRNSIKSMGLEALNVEFVIVGDEKDCAVYRDPVLIELVISNLMRLCVKTVAEDDKIFVKLERFTDIGNFIRIKIFCGKCSDVPESDLKPFGGHRLDDDIGMGIVAVNNIISEHKGNLSFNYSPGGYLFVMDLPINVPK